MCGRYSLPQSPDELLAELDLHDWPDQAAFRPSYNLAPTQALPVIRALPSPALALLRWGLVPRWVDDPKVGAKLINARSETLTSKPAFSPLLHRQRAVAVAAGYYEWRSSGTRKLPHYLHLPTGRLLRFAALWETWHGGPGPPIASFSIITTAAAPAIAWLHDRMPAILTPDEAAAWLNTAATPVAAALALLRPYTGELVCQAVAPLVSHLDRDGPDLIAPWEDDQPDLGLF